MANKYIRHGETYNGDGTTSAAATSNGGVGAWNNINVFQGTAPAYGTLAAGDVVYIRSKDFGGANITVTAAANITLGSASGTLGAPVKWILDAGSVWPGIVGTLTFSFGSSYKAIFTAHNHYIAELKDSIVILEANTNTQYKDIAVLSGGVQKLSGLRFDCSANTANPGNRIYFDGSVQAFLDDCSFKFRYVFDSILNSNNGYLIYVTNPDIEITAVTSNSNVFRVSDYGAKMFIKGGRVYGAGATTGMRLFASAANGCNIQSVGLSAPKTMDFCANAGGGIWGVEALGLDSSFGAAVAAAWGQADSRNDNNYPSLTAYLPNSANTPWSWKVYPSGASEYAPFNLTSAKVYTGSAATKTIAAEVLVADSITAANKNTMWVTVTYTDDATGAVKTTTSRLLTTTALDTSTAAWSAATYGAINLLKRKLSITTATSVKQDTLITVVLWGTWASASNLDLMFFDPDFAVT